MKWDWQPNIGIGHLKFNKTIDLASLGYGLQKFNKFEECNQKTYLLVNEGSSITIQGSNVFIDLECSNYCYFNEENLIGMTVKRFIQVIKKEHENVLIEITPNYISIDELGIMIWPNQDYVESVVVYKCLDL